MSDQKKLKRAMTKAARRLDEAECRQADLLNNVNECAGTVALFQGITAKKYLKEDLKDAIAAYRKQQRRVARLQERYTTAWKAWGDYPC